MLAVYLFLFALVAAHAHATPKTRQVIHDVPQCKPGSNWKEDCNSCFCSNNGLAACTRMSCSGPKVDIKKRQVIRGDPPRGGASCLEGAKWSDGCNSCFCGKNGAEACTKRLCIDSKTGKGMVCRPGASWNNGCNDCHCTETGVPACTKKICFLEEKRSVAKRSSGCVKGASWTNGCNHCSCINDGVAACTEMACFDPKTMKAMSCKPGASWNDGCNDCSCTESGIEVCTKKFCLKNKRDVIWGKCSPGASWRSGCQKCDCDEMGRPYCYKYYC